VFEIQNNGTLAAQVYASTPITLVSFNIDSGVYPNTGLLTDATATCSERRRPARFS
jgi:hypothetical protein